MPILKPYVYHSFSEQEYVDGLFAGIEFVLAHRPDLRDRFAAILTSHVGGGRESGETNALKPGESGPRVGPVTNAAANSAAIPLAQDSPRGEPCGAKAPCGHPLTEDSRRLGKCWYCEMPLERGGERA